MKARNADCAPRRKMRRDFRQGRKSRVCQSPCRFRRAFKGRSPLSGRIFNFAALALASLLLFNLSACQSLKRAAAPIVIFDACIAERGSLGVSFSAVNLSGRPVQGAQFFVSVRERGEDGSDDFGGEFFQTLFEFSDEIEAGGEERIFIPLEEFFDGLSSDEIEIESLHLESAVFLDGEVWERR